MTNKQRYSAIVDWFSENVGLQETELHYTTPWSLLVAVLLSAQCTDKRVNMVTGALMEAFPTPQKMAQAEPDEVFEYIRSISYPNAKANHLVKTAQILSAHGGEVPNNRAALESLPGVGRKTASVVLGVIFNHQTMPVDTHVFRVAHRVGLVDPSDKTPEDVEKKLCAHLPHERLFEAHHWLILHGRYVCKSKNPSCDMCGIEKYCKFAQQNRKNNVDHNSVK